MLLHQREVSARKILTSAPGAALRRDDRVALQGPRARRRRRAERQRLVRGAVAAHVEVQACVGGLDCGLCQQASSLSQTTQVLFLSEQPTYCCR